MSLKSIASLALLGATFLLPSAVSQAAPVFSLTPSSTISGPPGVTRGWGFAISNDTAFFLVVTGATINGPVGAEGLFSDYIGPNFIVVDPADSVTEAFNLALGRGVGSFAIDPASVPALYAGILQITYDLLVLNPLTIGGSSPGDIYGQSFSVDAFVDVTPASPVPEPTTISLVGGALAFLALRRRAASRKR